LRSLRQVVNTALRRATGYQLVKGQSAKAGGHGGRRFHDAQARATIRAVQGWTMTSEARVWALIVAVRHVVDHGIPGAMVECGVWRGGSMQAIARTLLDRDARDRDLHLFDTFTGMPPPGEEDRQVAGPPAGELLQSRPRTAHIWAIAGLDDVRAGMARTGYPADRIHYHAGMVEDTIPAQAPEQIALLRLDTDWHASTKHELEHLYDRVAPGGVIIFDDYDYWEGARKAVDEFVTAGGHRLLLVPIGSGRMAVKP
jgi:O-methyltransferase